MSSSLPSEIDVIIIGAGPTGLTLANLLGTLGVNTLIVETRATTSEMPRAIVLDDEGARTLQSAGLDQEAIGDALEGLGTRYLSANGEIIAEVGPGGREYGFPKRYFISQPSLERTLALALGNHPSVHVAFGATLLSFVQHSYGVDTQIAAGERTHSVRARWLVACDGAHSPVRESLGVRFDGNTYEQDWIVLDMAADPKTEAVTNFICDASRPTVCVPAPAGGRRYEFMVMPGEDRDAVLRPEFLARLLAPHRPWRTEDVVRAAVYTFHARLAAQWRVGRVLLAGDAAHLTPPFAGQGMNAGLRDAANLAWKLALELNGAASPGLLDTYDQERRGPCVAMIEVAVLMGRVVMPASAKEAAIQTALMQLVQETPALKQYLFEMRFKPRPQYIAGVMLKSEYEPPESLVGRMIPQPVLVNSGNAIRLDDTLGYRFSLIAQSPHAAQALADSSHPIWDVLQPAKLNLHLRRAAPPAGFSAIQREDMDLATPFRAHRDQILLVRPDRYVAAAFDPAEIHIVADQMESLLRQSAPSCEDPTATHILHGAAR